MRAPATMVIPVPTGASWWRLRRDDTGRVARPANQRLDHARTATARCLSGAAAAVVSMLCLEVSGVRYVGLVAVAVWFAGTIGRMAPVATAVLTLLVCLVVSPGLAVGAAVTVGAATEAAARLLGRLGPFSPQAAGAGIVVGGAWGGVIGAAFVVLFVGAVTAVLNRLLRPAASHTVHDAGTGPVDDA
jgi:hypothetical protein